ncbi:NAD(P)H-dependent flavin oxidoreductase [Hoyosella altamirensis]|uniref:Nitronate monooxygenase n=1 Tax=Hoyosella altamirensis TaxID=616997 RepID=A0A839RPV6_9ACTN|nr:nitronate monooxygenase [Hoyosella altamirensis]MBB3039032.1 nitronate monooxygenase [Hoyosella altamirensis]
MWYALGVLNTWLTKQLGLEIPIIGAPMGGRAGGLLAGEVSRAGGLGMLGAARYTTPEWVAAEAAIARRVGGSFGVGLMSWALDDDDALLTAALAEKPALVSLSFGDPAPYVDRVKDAGALVVSQVSTVEDMAVAEAAGVDAIVAQGTEAGGHTGRIATLTLLQEVLEATRLPVLAAGGIATGRGLAAVLAAGAHGAFVGTALLASPETTGPEYAIGRLLAARSTDTVYTDVFDKARHQPWPARWFGRAIVNNLSDKFDGAGASEDEIADVYDPADPDCGVVYAGQAAGLVTASRPVFEVVKNIAHDAEKQLTRVCGM